jgi:hypothetical protein
LVATPSILEGFTYQRGGRGGTREAVLRVDDDDLAALGLDEFLAVCREAGLEHVAELSGHGDGGIASVRVERPLEVSRLEELGSVEWVERVGSEAGAAYLEKLQGPDDSSSLARSDAPVSESVATVADDSFEPSLVGSESAVAGRVRDWTDADVPLELRRLGAFSPDESALWSLTDRQREVLPTAFELGYFDVPRAVTTREVAAELDLDPSTVSEHLQRAERRLLNSVFEAATG